METRESCMYYLLILYTLFLAGLYHPAEKNYPPFNINKDACTKYCIRYSQKKYKLKQTYFYQYK